MPVAAEALGPEHGLSLKNDGVGRKGRRLEEAPAVFGRELCPDAVGIDDGGVTSAGVIAVGDTARVEKGMDSRHLDVSDRDRYVVGDERSARGARPLECQVGRSELDVALRGRRVLQERVAEHRGEEVPRALHLRDVELDVIDRIELDRPFLRRRPCRREHPGSDGAEHFTACHPLHARTLSYTPAGIHCRGDPNPQPLAACANAGAAPSTIVIARLS